MAEAPRLPPLPRRRLRGDRRGNAVVEFAIIAPVFLLLVIGVIDMAFLHLTQAVLDQATRHAARLIATGQVQLGGGAAMFKSDLCTRAAMLIPCNALQTNVQAYSSFSAIVTPPKLDAKGNLGTQQFNPGTAGDEVLVQVLYPRPFLSTWVAQVTGRGTTAAVISTTVFQNEQYE